MRTLVRFLTGTSGAFAFALILLWARSYYLRDCVQHLTSQNQGPAVRLTYQVVNSERGILTVGLQRGFAGGLNDKIPSYWRFDSRDTRGTPAAPREGLGFAIRTSRHVDSKNLLMNDSYWSIAFPHWSAACVFSVPSAFAIGRYFIRHRRKQRVDAGLCEHCGYDLRASPGPCPECGAARSGRETGPVPNTDNGM